MALLLHVAGGLGLTVWALWCCRAGIDFTDEGFYLNWIARPWEFQSTVTHFGYVYHPLHRLVGGDLVLLRQANIVITLALSWVLFGIVFRSAPWIPHERERQSWLALAFIYSTAALAFLSFWLPTPSYRSLALQALLLGAIGVLLAQSNASPRSVAGWILIGVAGWLAFLAKPTTAAAMGILIAAQLAAARKSNRRLLIVAVATAVGLLCVTAWAIDGTLAAFVARLSRGVADVQNLQGGYGTSQLLRLDAFPLGPTGAIILVGASVAVAWVTTLSFLPRLSLASLIGVVVLGAGAVAVAALEMSALLSPHRVALHFLLAPAAALLAIFYLRARRASGRWPIRGAALPVGFALFPYAYAFGTNQNHWEAMAESAVFWAAAAAWLLVASRGAGTFRVRQALPIGAAMQIALGAILFGSTEYAYRQPVPLREQQTGIRIPFDGSGEVRVARETARYLRALEDAAQANGFQRGDALLDLTGRHATAVYHLGGRAIGIPWTLGGYPGTEAMLKNVLERVPAQELNRAWLLLEPNGPREIRPQLLLHFGIDPLTDYVQVASLKSPPGDGSAGLTQFLLKPRAASQREDK